MEKCFKCGNPGEYSISLFAVPGRWFLPNSKTLVDSGPPLTEISLCKNCTHELDSLITAFLPAPPEFPH